MKASSTHPPAPPVENPPPQRGATPGGTDEKGAAMKRRNKLCIVCLVNPARANSRCHTDDTYRKRTGRDRPEQLIVRHGLRQLEARIA